MVDDTQDEPVGYKRPPRHTRFRTARGRDGPLADSWSVRFQDIFLQTFDMANRRASALKS